MSCEFCKIKCNTCIHNDEQIGISDTWDDRDIIMTDVCGHDYEDCQDYKPDGKYCKMCGEKIN